jgi:hypothetical protein
MRRVRLLLWSTPQAASRPATAVGPARRLVPVLLVALLVGALVVASSHRARATGDGTSDSAVELLERARQAAGHETFSGAVDVRWRDAGGAHFTRVAARSVDGAFVVGRGTSRVVGMDSLRWSGHDGVGDAAWRAAAGKRPPSPDAEWDLKIKGTSEIAGRTATVVVAKDDDGHPRARFAIDSETGQLLKREVLDDHGQVLRSVAFASLMLISGPPDPAAVAPSAAAAPAPIKDVPDGYPAPDSVGDGYKLLGRYLDPDGSVQLFYGDGLFAVSVFEQPGEVDWDALPAGGADAGIDDVRARSYSTAEGTVVVWSADGVVLTCVADGPPEEAAGVVADVTAATSDDGVLHDIAHYVLDPFEWD